MGRQPESSVVSRVKVPVDLVKRPSLVSKVASLPIRAKFIVMELTTILILLLIVCLSSLARVVINKLVV